MAHAVPFQCVYVCVSVCDFANVHMQTCLCVQIVAF